MLWRNLNFFWLLFALAVLGVLLLRAARRRRELLRPFAEDALLARLESGVDARRRAMRLWLRLAALALLVVALAGPKWGFTWQEVRREGIDLIVALDTSRSMLATDVKPNRLERAKLAVLDLVARLEGDRVGLVPFAGTAFLECPLTLDYAAFERSLRSTQVGIIPRGGTSLARAIETGLQGFEARQGKYEILIMITDGEDNEGGVEEAIGKASEAGVKVFTVGIGTTEGELIPAGEGQAGYVKDRQGQVVKSRLDEETLKQIALETGGAYVRGLGPSLGLDQVFEEHIAKMERRDVSSSLERRYEERFQIPLAAALFLFLLEVFLGERRKAGEVARRRFSRAARRGWRRPREAEAALLLLCFLPFLVGWLDPPGDRAAEGNRLYESGKYEEAEKKYGEGLVDAPQSELLRFNMAAALYKQGKYDDAMRSLAAVAASADSRWAARASYNLGNAQYRLGANAEESDPQAAIAAYEQALASYKRAISADAGDIDAKFNHEFVAKKLAELRERLEREKEEQEQQKQQEQQESESGEQGEQQEQQAGDEPSEEEGTEPQEQASSDESEPPGEEEGGAEDQAAGGEPEAEPGDSESAATESGDEQATRAVLDTARSEELGPEEVRRPVGVAGLGEPSQDW
jgi:Ca-activated chloride channel family protein